jgi:GNAT superfamily N-acetyltransferase
MTHGTGFRLRVARTDDADGVTAVLASAYPQLLGPAYDPAVLALALPKMTAASPRLLASGTYYVQEAPDGQIVACGGWTHAEPGTGKIANSLAHLRHFGTHPDWTGQGLARAIAERCRAGAVAAGVRRLNCFSTLSAEPFYTALGFIAVERIELAMGDGVRFPSVLMVWDKP